MLRNPGPNKWVWSRKSRKVGKWTYFHKNGKVMEVRKHGTKYRDDFDYKIISQYDGAGNKVN